MRQSISNNMIVHKFNFLHKDTVVKWRNTLCFHFKLFIWYQNFEFKQNKLMI